MNTDDELLSYFSDTNSLRLMWDQGLRAEAFPSFEMQGLYNFTIDYWRKSGMQLAPTTEVLAKEFKTFDFHKETEIDINYLIEDIKKRQLKLAYEQAIIGATVDNDPNVDPESAIRDLQGRLYQASESVASRNHRIDRDYDVRMAEYESTVLASGPDGKFGAPLGLKEVDEHTRGVLSGELAAIGARLKVGKSWTLANSFVACVRAGLVPINFTLELPVKQMRARTEAIVSGLDSSDILNHTINAAQFPGFCDALEEFYSLGDWHIEQPARGDRTVPALMARARDVGADVVFIDQLSYMESVGTYKDQHRDIQEIVFSLKSDIVAREDLAVILAVQINREGAKAKKPASEHIALSDAVGQVSDILYSLERSDEMKANNSAKLEIMDTRRGAEGAWNLKWELKGRTSFGVRSVWENN